MVINFCSQKKLAFKIKQYFSIKAYKPNAATNENNLINMFNYNLKFIMHRYVL